MQVRLYNKPKVAAGNGWPALAVDGAFGPAMPPGAYEGRLQIHSAIGDCRVRLLTGDLPPGYTLGVDNDTMEVVLRWPAYQSETVSIPNGNFEDGDKDWDLGPGWSIDSGVVNTDPGDPSGTYVAQYANQGGDSLLFNKMVAPVTPGTTIHASCDVQQGASSKGNAGAAVRLRFVDAAGNQVGSDAEGNAVMSGSDAHWHASSLAAAVRAGAAGVRIGARGIRKRQNRPLWLDNFQWDVRQAALGLPPGTGSIPLSLRVFDSAGRHADWSGAIDIVDHIAPILGATRGTLALGNSTVAALAPDGENLAYVSVGGNGYVSFPSGTYKKATVDKTLTEVSSSAEKPGQIHFYAYTSPGHYSTYTPGNVALSGFDGGSAIMGCEGSFGSPYFLVNNVQVFGPVRVSTEGNGWAYSISNQWSTNWCQFDDDHVFIYANSGIYRWPKDGVSSNVLLADASLATGINNTDLNYGYRIWSLARDGYIYFTVGKNTGGGTSVLHVTSKDLTLDFSLPWSFASAGINAIGVDKGYLFVAFTGGTSGQPGPTTGINVYRVSTGEKVGFLAFSAAGGGGRRQFIFTDDTLYLQFGNTLYSIEYTPGVDAPTAYE